MNDDLDPLLGIKDAEKESGLNRSTIWRRVKAGTFPAPQYVGEMRKWRRSEIRAWVAAQAARPASARRLARNLGEHPVEVTP